MKLTKFLQIKKINSPTFNTPSAAITTKREKKINYENHPV